MFGSTFACFLHSVYLRYNCYDFLQKNPSRAYVFFNKYSDIICYTMCDNNHFLTIYDNHLKVLKRIYEQKKDIHSDMDIVFMLDFMKHIAFNCIPLNCSDETQEYIYPCLTKDDFYHPRLVN